MKNIIFYNYCRNGDIHVSRNFVRELCNNLGPNKYFYLHKNDSCLLEDIPFIEHQKLADNIQTKRQIPPLNLVFKFNDNNYINTWFSSDNKKYIKTYGITFDCLYFLFKDIYSKFGLKIEKIFNNPFDILPIINYNKININNVHNFYEKHKSKKNVLICNGAAMSNQAKNFDFSNIITQLASQYKNINFILTNQLSEVNKNYDNIYYTSEIINKKNISDLNEISYLSLKCDVIVGRASGPFTFSMVKENFDNPNKIMISFSDLAPSGVGDFYLHTWGKNNIKYKAKVIQSNETDSNKVLNIIKNNL